MTTRYIVTTTNGPDDVGADEMKTGPGGTLEFWTGGRLVIAYAPHAWVSAEYEGQEEGD